MTLVIFGAAAVLFAFLLIFQKTLYGAAMCLLAVLLQVAAIFFVLGAQMLGFIQVLAYAGAIMVLIVVAIMAGPPQLRSRWASLEIPFSLVFSVLFLLGLEFAAVLLLGGSSVPAAFIPVAASAVESGMARLLFGEYALATEVVGLLFLVAALAVVDDRLNSVSKGRRS